jgi:hypothetical protein
MEAVSLHCTQAGVRLHLVALARLRLYHSRAVSANGKVACLTVGEDVGSFLCGGRQEARRDACATAF